MRSMPISHRPRLIVSGATLEYSHHWSQWHLLRRDFPKVIQQTRSLFRNLQAERQLLAAQRDFANARYTYVRNLFQFKQTIGSLNPDDIEQLDQWMTAP